MADTQPHAHVEHQETSPSAATAVAVAAGPTLLVSSHTSTSYAYCRYASYLLTSLTRKSHDSICRRTSNIVSGASETGVTLSSKSMPMGAMCGSAMSPATAA